MILDEFTARIMLRIHAENPSDLSLIVRLDQMWLIAPFHALPCNFLLILHKFGVLLSCNIVGAHLRLCSLGLIRIRIVLRKHFNQRLASKGIKLVYDSMFQLLPLDPLVMLFLLANHVLRTGVLPVSILRAAQDAELLLDDPSHLTLLHDLTDSIPCLVFGHLPQQS